jgi:hypothetical protein
MLPGSVTFTYPVCCATMNKRIVLEARIKLAIEALEHSTPNAAHYPEPVQRHKDALRALHNILDDIRHERKALGV